MRNDHSVDPLPTERPAFLASRRLIGPTVIGCTLAILAACDSQSGSGEAPTAATESRTQNTKPGAADSPDAIASGSANAQVQRVPVPPNLERFAPDVIEQFKAAVEAVDASPRDPDRWRTLGMLYHANLEFDLARRCYRRVTELNDADARAWYYLAIASERLGEIESALDAVNRTIALTDDFTAAHWRRGLWCLDQGRLEEAADSVSDALEIDPTSREARTILARVRIQAEDAEAAIETLTSLLEEMPEDGYLLFLLGTAQRQAGLVDEARHTLSRGVSTRPPWGDPWMTELAALKKGNFAAYTRAQAMIEAGDVEQAVDLLERSIKKSPDEIFLLLELARACRLTNRLDRAVEVLHQAGDVAPEDNRVPFHLAASYRRKAMQSTSPERERHVETALGYVDACLEMNDRFALGHAMRGDILLLQQRFDEAIESHRRAWSINPGNALFPHRLGAVLVGAKRWHEAIEALKAARAIDSSNIDTLSLLCIALANTDQFDKALGIVEAERAKAPQNPQLVRLRDELIKAKSKAAAGSRSESP